MRNAEFTNAATGIIALSDKPRVRFDETYLKLQPSIQSDRKKAAAKNPQIESIIYQFKDGVFSHIEYKFSIEYTTTIISSVNNSKVKLI